jgi:hypothetical protein
MLAPVVEVFVPAALYGSIHIGMQATVVAGEPVGGARSATIEVIDPLIDARSGTFDKASGTRFPNDCAAV